MVKQYDYDSMAEYYDILDGSLIPYDELSAELIKKYQLKAKKLLIWRVVRGILQMH